MRSYFAHSFARRFSSCALLSTHNRPVVVAVEGNISSGKSTLCRFLNGKTIQAHPDRATPIQCVFESISPRLLKLFYENPSKYAFTLQLQTLCKRLDTVMRRWLTLASPHLLLLDRSTIGDFIFALAQWLNGRISDDEMQVYQEEANMHECSDFFRRFLTSIVYLHSNPYGCGDNARKRSDVDANVGNDYLTVIDDLHFYAMWSLLLNSDFASRLVVVDWRNQMDKGGVEQMLMLLKRVSLLPACPPLSNLASPSSSSSTSLTSHAPIQFSSLPSDEEVARRCVPISDLLRLASANKLPDTVYIDLRQTLHGLPPQLLPRLPAPFRFRHSQSFKDVVMVALSQRKTVICCYPASKRPQTMLDFFLALKYAGVPGRMSFSLAAFQSSRKC